MATQEEMDQAALEAEKELRKLDHDSVMKVAEWWNTHFRKAGHKRLGRLLVSVAREPELLEAEEE